MDSYYYYFNELILISYINRKGEIKNMEKNLFDILEERGYVKDLTHRDEIIELINGEPMTFYLGIDPTADSLHIGHFFCSNII